MINLVFRIAAMRIKIKSAWSRPPPNNDLNLKRRPSWGRQESFKQDVFLFYRGYKER